MVLAHEATVIKIQQCKTKLFLSKVEYLGHKISKGGVSMIPKYMHKINDWPIPKSGKEVAAFLGFAGYYHTFIPQYSAMTNRLNGIKKAENFLWNKEIAQHFCQVEESIHQGRDTSFSLLQSRRSVHLNH